MKRILQDHLGRPGSEKSPQDVVGRPAMRRVADVASFLHDTRALREESDAELLSEFAEFLAGPGSPRSQFRTPPDPVFKERLRRRLWRLHLLMQPTNPHESH